MTATLPQSTRAPVSQSIRVGLATADDRARIYRIRHVVYAHELHQHPENSQGFLRDPLDDFNHYLVASEGNEVVGFISVTPPEGPSYSIDKYIRRSELPFAVDSKLYEVRLLTVVASKRRKEIAPLLMYAALRWVESHGGNAVMAIGRCEILSLYSKAGLRPTGIVVRSGAVTFEVIHATTEHLRRHLESFGDLLDRFERKADWQLGIPFRKPAACFHGGAFFSAIGERFDALERSKTLINADVLDAWFDPSPKVLAALHDYLPWLLRTSPPTDASGLVETISRVRGVPAEAVLPGAGSSALIFLAFTRWLHRSARALILDPTYGEYPHVLEKVIGCKVDRLPLMRETNYRVDLDQLRAALAEEYDLVVLVNPNSPTGQHIERDELIPIMEAAPTKTRFWVDETYIEYVESFTHGRNLCASAPFSLTPALSRWERETAPPFGVVPENPSTVDSASFSNARPNDFPLPAGEGQGEGEGNTPRSEPRNSKSHPIPNKQSLESFAAQSSNVVVCKSMSKVYALSGVRAAYLCAPPHLLEELRAFTPPWAVSLPAQVAAVHALQDADYYAARYAETHHLRDQLMRSLTPLGFDIVPTRTNFFLAHLSNDGPDAAQLVEHCRARGLFLRDASGMGTTLGNRALRIAVKDAAINQRMVEILTEVLRSASTLQRSNTSTL